MISILVAIIGAFITLFGALTLFSDPESGPPNLTYSLVTIAIGIAIIGFAWLIHRRRNHNFDKQLQAFAGGTGHVAWTRVYLLSNRLGLLFTRARALAYANGSLALISPNGKVTPIPLPADSQLEISEPYLAIMTSGQLFLVADVSMWKALLSMLVASGAQSSAIGSASGSAAASAVGAKYAQSHLDQLKAWKTQTNLKIHDMTPARQSTLNYHSVLAIIWAFVIIFAIVGVVIGMDSEAGAQRSLVNMTLWGFIFAIMLVAAGIWRIKRKIQPSIIKAFSKTDA